MAAGSGPAGPDRNKEPVQLRNGQAGSSSRCGANLAGALINAGIVLEHINGARTTNDIDPMTSRIDKEVVSIAAGVEISDDRPVCV